MPKASYKFLLQKNQIATALTRHCTENKWNCETVIDDDKTTRVDISDLKSKIPVIIYANGTVVLQGKDCDLKVAIDTFLEKAENNPEILVNEKIPSIQEHNRRCFTYKIANKNIRDKIKTEIEKMPTLQDLKTAGSGVNYRYKIKEGRFDLVITQYDNGTLMLQGKTDSLWDKICSIIEQGSNLSEKEVAVRFVSSDNKDMEKIVKVMTDELVVIAKQKAEEAIGSDGLLYLNNWDKKYLISGFSLLELDLQHLPEYTCVVMPIAKAYEGFLLKICTDLGFTTLSDTKKPGWNFSKAWDSAKCKDYEKKNKLRKPKINELKNTLELARHLSMHSDGSALMQIETLEKAKEKIDSICTVIKGAYSFFIVNKGKG